MWLMESMEISSSVRRAVGALSRRLRAECPENGLNLTKLSLLGHLHQKGSLSAAQLATLEHVQPQSLTRVLAELVAEGLVSRRADATDGRRLLLDITGGGRDLLARDVQQRDAWLAKAMADLSVTERELLRLAAHLMERLADPT
jgi:DNA-binding MarR family transcriptional regulator